MRKFILLFICLQAIGLYAQEGVTFTLDKLKPPKNRLPEKSSDEIFEKLILSQISESYSIKHGENYPYNIYATSKVKGNLVGMFGSHPFLSGMYSAYADHRPFVLSPDMIWLLINQGFARHINADPEKYRPYITNSPEKQTLIAVAGGDLYDSESWETVFPQFSEKIGDYIGEELITLLTADFTTTTGTERIASQITIMDAMKPYFEYMVFWIVCGIPKITIQGTTEDWEKVLQKTTQLGAYTQFDISWWTDELIPLLEEFVKASRNEVDIDFWRNMFKYYSPGGGGCGTPNVIDGWIVKFFPYDKYGKRNNLKEIYRIKELPNEIVCVDFMLKEFNLAGDTQREVNMEFWAGFIGLEQDSKTYKLTPQIGWMVREKENRSEEFANFLSRENTNFGIFIKVSEVPDEIIQLGTVEKLDIIFIDSIRIPDKMATMHIKQLNLKGNIEPQETERIKNLLVKVEELFVNGKQIKRTVTKKKKK